MHIKKLFNFDFFLNLNLIFKFKNIIPDFQVRDISELKSILKNLDVKGLIFDIDQTIVPFRQTKVSTDFSLLLQDVAKNYRCCLLSNFVPSPKKIIRIKAIEDQINIKTVVADKKKPDPASFRQALNFIDLPPEKVIMIGDRIFTDVVGANHIGMRTILLKPLNIKTDPIFLVTLPRFFENFYLKFAKWFTS